MKKIAVMMVLVLGAAFAAQADLLYFRANAFDWSGPKRFDYASVGVAKDGKTNWGAGDTKVFLTIQPDPDTVTGLDYVTSDADRYNAVGWADLAGYTTAEYTFYVETYDAETGWTDPIWGYSEDTAKSYAQLKEAGSIYIPGETDPQDLTAWNVPEPTSGLLSLFGLAVLALKRKRVSTGRSLVIPYRTW